jgi:CHASE3 domain sensor protein
VANRTGAGKFRALRLQWPPMRRQWGLRARVLVAAAITAAVALVTFAILLKALQDQRDAAAQGRATTEAIATAGELERIALDMESGVRGFVLTDDRTLLASYDRGRARLPAAGARLAQTERDAP